MSTAFPWGTPQVETVEFLGEQIGVVPGEDRDHTMIVMRDVLENLGIANQSHQYDRIREAPEFAGRWYEIVLPSAGGPQKQFCLSLSRLTLYLATISSMSVLDAGVRDKVVRYKLECADVLDQHFFGAAASAEARSLIDDILPPNIVTSLDRLRTDQARDHATIATTLERLFAWLVKRLSQQWQPFPIPVRRYALLIHRKYFGDGCLCCGRVIFDADTFLGDFDHWDGNGLNLSPSNCMPMCKTCNEHEKRHDAEGFRARHRRVYEAFQEHVRRDKAQLTAFWAEFKRRPDQRKAS
jgi:hypothetical protein